MILYSFKSKSVSNKNPCQDIFVFSVKIFFYQAQASGDILLICWPGEDVYDRERGGYIPRGIQDEEAFGKQGEAVRGFYPESICEDRIRIRA